MNTLYPAPASCPMCDREAIWFSDIQMMLGKYFAVVCVCGLQGPVAVQKHLAAHRWNEQAVRMKSYKEKNPL